MITLKGTKGGLIIRLSVGLSPEAAKEQLAEKLLEAEGFFQGAKVTVRLEADGFSEAERLDLQEEIQRLLPQTAICFQKPPVETAAKADAEPEKPDSPTEKLRTSRAQACSRGDMFYKGTVRSGQVLRTAGNLVVLGDVNPGAELYAGGDIVVMGTARGMLWAGLFGNSRAVVSAARLVPTQIRIADIIARRPDGDTITESAYPEFATVRGQRICIERTLSS